MYDLVTIGDCTIDIFNILDDPEVEVVCQIKEQDCQLCFTYADKIPATQIIPLVAGNAANNAVGSSRLGMKVGIYTIIGDDVNGQAIKKTLEDEGVATEFIVTDRTTPTNIHTVLTYKGERTILVHHASHHYRLPQIGQSRWLYLTSQAAGSARFFDEVVAYVKESRAKLVYQPGTFQLRFGLAESKDLLAQTEVIIMNREEAIEYLKVTPQILVPELITLLRAHGPKIAIVTDGTKGSYAGNNQEMWFLGTDPSIPRIESTGAGDAYASGLTAALMHGHDLPEAMRWGTFNAEGVIQQIGPQAGLRTRESIEAEAARRQSFQAQKI